MSSVVASALAFCAFSCSLEDATRFLVLPKSSDQLCKATAGPCVLKKARGRERSGRDSSRIFCIGSSNTGGCGGQLCCPCFANYLMLCESEQAANADPRIVLDGHMFGFRARELLVLHRSRSARWSLLG